MYSGWLCSIFSPRQAENSTYIHKYIISLDENPPRACQQQTPHHHPVDENNNLRTSRLDSQTASTHLSINRSKQTWQSPQRRSPSIPRLRLSILTRPLFA